MLGLARSCESISCLSWAHLWLQARCKEKAATTSPRTTAGWLFPLHPVPSTDLYAVQDCKKQRGSRAVIRGRDSLDADAALGEEESCWP